MREYEGTFIFRASLDDDGIAKEIEQVEGLIKSEGGEPGEWDKWGKRRLAYEIKDESDGYYAFLTFKGTPESIERLVAAFRLRENILRTMFIVKDK